MKSIRRKSDGLEIARARIADSFLSRFVGLIGIQHFNFGDGLYFPRCNSVHMWFMRISIDVIFLDRDGNVTSTNTGLNPWRALPVWDLRARDALELLMGSVARYSLRRGDTLCLD